MRPNELVGRRAHDEAYDPLYEEAASLGVPLVLCEMGGSVLHQIGTDRFDGFFSREAVLDPYEMMLVFMSFMGHNVLERFPASISATSAPAWAGFRTGSTGSTSTGAVSSGSTRPARRRRA